MKETHATLKIESNTFLKEFDLKQTKLYCAFSLGLINMLQRHVPISFANAAICKTTELLNLLSRFKQF